MHIYYKKIQRYPDYCWTKQYIENIFGHFITTQSINLSIIIENILYNICIKYLNDIPLLFIKNNVLIISKIIDK